MRQTGRCQTAKLRQERMATANEPQTAMRAGLFHFSPLTVCQKWYLYSALWLPKRVRALNYGLTITQEYLWHTNYLRFLIPKMRSNHLLTRRRWRFTTTNI